jgi:hypothetical protein
VGITSEQINLLYGSPAAVINTEIALGRKLRYRMNSVKPCKQKAQVAQHNTLRNVQQGWEYAQSMNFIYVHTKI